MTVQQREQIRQLTMAAKHRLSVIRRQWNGGQITDKEFQAAYQEVARLVSSVILALQEMEDDSKQE